MIFWRSESIQFYFCTLFRRGGGQKTLCGMDLISKMFYSEKMATLNINVQNWHCILSINVFRSESQQISIRSLFIVRWKSLRARSIKHQVSCTCRPLTATCNLKPNLTPMELLTLQPIPFGPLAGRSPDMELRALPPFQFRSSWQETTWYGTEGACFLP